MPHRFRLFCLLLALLVPASTASAGSTQESIFEDDYQLLERGPAERDRALDDIAALGADSLRVLVVWNRVAPNPRSKRVPKKLRSNRRAANPRSYPATTWDRYDDLLRAAHLRGLDVLFSPTGPVPAWASQCKGSAAARRTCKPHPGRFGAFVRALGRRYSGAYADENQGGGVLPRVGRWSIWNEPNQAGWLSPQYVRVRGRKRSFAPQRYRALALQAIRALRATGHRSDQILLGETAPIGRTTGSLARRPMPPVDFIRDLFCLSKSGRKLRGGAARAVGCRRAPRFAVSGFAHHPYTRGGSQPPMTRTLPTEITIATVARLKRLLDQAGRARVVRRGLPIWYTEFGFQTNPPDQFAGVPLAQQAAYINQSDYIAYRDRRVKSVAQYKLIDEPNVASFQTGLRFFRLGRAKPAYDAYRLPLWVVRRGGYAAVYGQLRPAADGSAEQVEVQVQPPGGGAFETVETVAVDSSRGHFLRRVPLRQGSWRLKWTPAAGGPTLYSRTATAGRR